MNESIPVCGDCGKRHVVVIRGFEQQSCAYHRVKARDENGAKIPCKAMPVDGRPGCRKHFGSVPVGPAHHNWKGGGSYFKVPKGMKDAYERSLNDPMLASNRKQLALLDAQIQETLDSIDDEEGRIKADDLASWIERERVARASGDLTAISKNAAEVDVIVSRLGRLREARKELREIIESRRKVAATELELVKFGRDALMATELIAILTKVVESLKKHDAPRSVIKGVASDFAGLLASGAENDD